MLKNERDEVSKDQIQPNSKSVEFIYIRES